MAQLRQEHQSFVERNVTILVVGPEGADKFKRFFEEHHLPFSGLPDPEHRVLKLYGQEIKLFKFGRMPAQVLVDKEGSARLIHYGDSMSDIPDAESILVLVDQINAGQDSLEAAKA